MTEVMIIVVRGRILLTHPHQDEGKEKKCKYSKELMKD